MRRRPRVKDKLGEIGIAPSKARGQNFLIDPFVAPRIIEFARIPQDADVVEIGAGLGALTQHIRGARTLTLIEVEERLCADLRVSYPHARIVNADARTVSYSDFGSSLWVLGNIPYSASSAIVLRLLEERASIACVTLMLQKEFAERLAAVPGGRNRGSLSVWCQVFADITLGPVVLGDSFHPPTEVQSQLVRFVMNSEARMPIPDLRWFERVLRASFLKRRKTVINSLRAAALASPEALEAAFLETGIDPRRRAETLELAEFIALSNAIPAPPKRN